MRQLVANAVEDAGEQFLAVAARRAQGPGQHLGAMRVDQREAQILQLAVQLVETQAQGDRRVDFQRFAGDAGALVGAHGRHGLQVVLAVGQLDEHDAQVARHRHQHLAEVFGLRLLIRGELHLVELGQAIDQLGDFLAEAFGQLMLGGPRIFEDIVHQGCADGVGIHPPLDDGTGHSQRMSDIGFAGHALLVRMRFSRKGVGGLDSFYIDSGEIVETIEENPVGGLHRARRQR